MTQVVRNAAIPVIFGVDVEPDPRLVNRSAPEPWTGFEGVHRILSAMRPRIAEATGSPVRYSWFFRMDPQIAESYGSPGFAVERYPQLVTEMERHGDELGVHPHPYRWRPREQVWTEDYGDSPWVKHCLDMSLEAFRSAVGRSCRAARFGDAWLSTEAVDWLERAGVAFDLTVEPGTPRRRPFQSDERGSGWVPNLCRVPREPYTPSRSDFRRPAASGSREIRVVPLTSGYQEGLPLPHRLRRLALNGWRYRRQDTPVALWRNWKAPNTFERVLGRALEAQKRPYLAVAARTDSRMASKLPAIFDALLSQPDRRRFVFTTPAQAVEMLEQTPASARAGA
jgi:hypothetical protein